MEERGKNMNLKKNALWLNNNVQFAFPEMLLDSSELCYWFAMAIP